MTDLTEMYPSHHDEEMNACRRWADEVYGTHLKHERIAWQTASFLRARIAEQPDSPERDALLSVVNASEATATYMSSGMKAIRLALAFLFRLTLPYADHPDYDERWRP